MADDSEPQTRSKSPGHQGRASVSPARSTKRRSSASPGRTSRSRSPLASPGKRKKKKKKTTDADADEDDDPPTPFRDEEDDDAPGPALDDTMDASDDIGEPDNDDDYDEAHMGRIMNSLAAEYSEPVAEGEHDQLVRLRYVHFDSNMTQGQTRKLDPAHVAEVEDGMIQNPPATHCSVILWRKNASSMLCP
jgi:hypothetical protein